MSQYSTYTHQTTIRVTEEMWLEILKDSKRCHITSMEWMRRAFDEKLHRKDMKDEIIPVNGMSYRDLEEIIINVFDSEWKKKFEELDADIDEMDKQIGISNRPRPPNMDE